MTSQMGTISVNGETYDIAEMAPQQREVVRHIYDLENQITEVEFRLAQLRVAREAFASTLAGLLQGADKSSTA